MTWKSFSCSPWQVTYSGLFYYIFSCNWLLIQITNNVWQTYILYEGDKKIVVAFKLCKNPLPKKWCFDFWSENIVSLAKFSLARRDKNLNSIKLHAKQAIIKVTLKFSLTCLSSSHSPNSNIWRSLHSSIHISIDMTVDLHNFGSQFWLMSF